MESATVVEEGDRRYLHYMKAIPTQEVCLACHGSNVKEPVREAIAKQYPADAATGFEKGELRGAFTFVKPLTAE
jgi:cytochrome c551/c552